MKIIVIGLNWLGDIIMSLPAIKALAAQNELHIITRPHLKEAYELLPEKLFIHPIQTKNNIFKLLKDTAPLRRLKADCAIALPNSFRAGMLAKMCKPKLSVGFSHDLRGFLLKKNINLPASFKQMHESRLHFMLAKAVCKAAVMPSLYCFKPNAQDLKNVLNKIGLNEQTNYFVLAPGAAFGSAKQWPANKFAILTVLLKKHFNCAAVISGGKAEQHLASEICQKANSQEISSQAIDSQEISSQAINGQEINGQAINGQEISSQEIIDQEISSQEIIDQEISSQEISSQEISNQAINAAGKTSIKELAILLSGAKCLVANDSGTAHLAALTQTPTVIAAGPTDLTRTGPLNKQLIIVQNNLCPLSPCRKRVCKAYNHVCMQAIKPQEVFEAVKNLTKKQAS